MNVAAGDQLVCHRTMTYYEWLVLIVIVGSCARTGFASLFSRWAVTSLFRFPRLSDHNPRWPGYFQSNPPRLPKLWDIKDIPHKADRCSQATNKANALWGRFFPCYVISAAGVRLQTKRPMERLLPYSPKKVTQPIFIERFSSSLLLSISFSSICSY